jgi:hypothetical protein
MEMPPQSSIKFLATAAVRHMNKGSEELEPIIIWDRELGS